MRTWNNSRSKCENKKLMKWEREFSDLWFGESSRPRDWDCQRLQGTSLTDWECPHRRPNLTWTIYPPRLIWRGDRTSHSRRNNLRYLVSSIHKERKKSHAANFENRPFPCKEGDFVTQNTIHRNRYGKKQRLCGNSCHSHSHETDPIRDSTGKRLWDSLRALCSEGQVGLSVGLWGLRGLRDCLTGGDKR